MIQHGQFNQSSYQVSPSFKPTINRKIAGSRTSNSFARNNNVYINKVVPRSLHHQKLLLTVLQVTLNGYISAEIIDRCHYLLTRIVQTN